MLKIHQSIHEKLNYFLEINKIPNLLFHGPNGSGKKTIVKQFIDKIYTEPTDKQQYILEVNCGMGKGIKFIRDELKFFAKTNIDSSKPGFFKTKQLYYTTWKILPLMGNRHCVGVLKYIHLLRVFLW